MIKIEIQNTQVRERSGTSPRTGKQYNIREQEGYAYLFDRSGRPNAYPVRIVLTLDADQPAYSVGDYYIAPESIHINRFDQLVISPKLQRDPWQIEQESLF